MIGLVAGDADGYSSLTLDWQAVSMSWSGLCCSYTIGCVVFTTAGCYTSYITSEDNVDSTFSPLSSAG